MMSNNKNDVPLKSPGRPGSHKRRSEAKTAYKYCPSCKEPIPVACRTCPCGHVFVSRRQRSKSEVEKLKLDASPSTATSTQTTDKPKTAPIVSEDSDTVKPRRTERRKAERPNFFNSLEVDIATKRPKQFESPTKKKRGRPRVSIEKPPPETTTTTPHEEKKTTTPRIITPTTTSPQNDLFANVPAAKMLQYSIILSELNRKMCGQTFPPV